MIRIYKRKTEKGNTLIAIFENAAREIFEKSLSPLWGTLIQAEVIFANVKSSVVHLLKSETK